MEYENQETGPENDLAAMGMPPETDVITAGKAPETVNLAETTPAEDATSYVTEVCNSAEKDWDSSKKFRQRRAKILKLAIGDIPPPSDGEKFRLARIHFPIIMKANLRLGARIFDQQIPSNGEYFGCKPIDATDLERSVRIAKHMNWQIARKVPEYVPNHDILINQCLLYGSAFSYVYWGEEKNGPCHEACRTEDIILPYWRHSSDPSLADVPRITRILRYQRHELEEKERVGYYTNVKKLYKKLDENSGSTSQAEDERFTGPVQQAIDKDAGIEKPSDDPDSHRVLLEQHRWLKLKGEDRMRPVIVTVDYGTKTLLCLKIREDEDPVDRARFNRQKQANEAMYQAAMEKYSMDMAAYAAGQFGIGVPTPPDMTQMPMPGPQTMTAPPIPGETTPSMPMGQPPQMPTPPPEPKAPRMVTINFFTHYICFPNPEGIYGLGIGTLLEGNNVAADTLGSQVVDAGTLANTVTGLRSRQAKLRGGEFRISPGEIVECDLAPQDLEKGIHLLKFPGPEPALGQLIKDLKEEAEALSGAGDILSGEVGGSNETATTTQIRIGEAMTAIAIMSKRYYYSRTIEAKKFARLNSVYLKDTEFFPVVDPLKTVQGSLEDDPIQVSRMDYLEDTDITITADPRMASRVQRFQEALQAWNLVNASQFLSQIPQLVFAVARELFLAMDRPDLLRGLEQAMQFMPPPGAASPGMPPQGGQPPAGPPEGGGGGGPPRPKPENPGQKVPNTEAQPANAQPPKPNGAN